MSTLATTSEMQLPIATSSDEALPVAAHAGKLVVRGLRKIYGSRPERAATLLEGLNLKDRDNDGVREDAKGRPVRFAVLIQAGVTSAQTAMAFLRDALANVGVGLDIVALDLGAVMGQWQAGQYDAVFHYIQVSDTDPASNLDFWLSRGSSHLWHPNQKAPATAWESRTPPD